MTFDIAVAVLTALVAALFFIGSAFGRFLKGCSEERPEIEEWVSQVYCSRCDSWSRPIHGPLEYVRKQRAVESEFHAMTHDQLADAT